MRPVLTLALCLGSTAFDPPTTLPPMRRFFLGLAFDALPLDDLYSGPLDDLDLDDLVVADTKMLPVVPR